jgi:hypothetical protein
LSACRRQCAPIRPRAVVPATSSALRNNRPIQRKGILEVTHRSQHCSFEAAGRIIFRHHNHAKDKLAQPASVKALATGVINERSKYRQEERREGGLLQFQDKQSVRMATRGDHLHYSKQKPGTEPHQNVYEQIDDPCRRPRPKNQLLQLSRLLCRRL